MEALVSLEGESAFVTATDPATGEVLKGTLVGTSQRPAGPPPMDPFAGSAVAPGPAGPSGASLMSAGPRTLRLVGDLVGDRGTTLHCEVALEQRIRVRGQGICNAVQQGSEQRYILVF